MKLNISFDFDSPAEIGADRIVNAAAAFHLWPGDLVVLDFGTATTVEFVSAAWDACSPRRAASSGTRSR